MEQAVAISIPAIYVKGFKPYRGPLGLQYKVRNGVL